MAFLEGIKMTTPIQILELMDPKAASDLTHVIKMFDKMLDENDNGNGVQILNFVNNTYSFRNVLKSILGIKQNDNSLGQIEHSGPSSS